MVSSTFIKTTLGAAVMLASSTIASAFSATSNGNYVLYWQVIILLNVATTLMTHGLIYVSTSGVKTLMVLLAVLKLDGKRYFTISAFLLWLQYRISIFLKTFVFHDRTWLHTARTALLTSLFLRSWTFSSALVAILLWISRILATTALPSLALACCTALKLVKVCIRSQKYREH